MSDEELKPTEAGIQAADEALAVIEGRSFSGRHPELGKMIKCQMCRTRHRAAKVCEQKFATGRYDMRDPKPLLIAGETPETKPVPPMTGIKVVLGALVFKGKRIKPHLNKRAKEFIQLVRTLVPDEYTPEELEKARNKAKRVLAAKYGRHGFLPPIWQKFEKKKIHPEDLGKLLDEQPITQLSNGSQTKELIIDGKEYEQDVNAPRTED